jgi:hypothetical protein
VDFGFIDSFSPASVNAFAFRDLNAGTLPILYKLQFHVRIRRWLTAPLMSPEGRAIERTKGTPQGGLCEALHKPPYVK